jgi:hypothetical protein
MFIEEDIRELKERRNWNGGEGEVVPKLNNSNRSLPKLSRDSSVPRFLS